MTEEEKKEKRKKTAVLLKILKWLWVGILTLLLVAGLIFQVPWKVMTLLVIILMACTILPKQLRKWFWAGVGAVVIALIVWVFLPDRGEWQPFTYNFDKELAALEAKRAIPNEENAATTYNKLLESYDANELDPISLGRDVFNSIYPNPWLSEDYPEAAAWLQHHQSTIDTLIEASKIEKCRFPISDPTNIEPQIDRNAAIRRWVYLIIIAANNDLGEGRINQTFEKYITVLRMANQIYQQPTIIDMLVGIATEAIPVKHFRRFIIIGDATETDLNTIEKALTDIKYDWSTSFTRILEYEKSVIKSTFAKSYEVNQEGKTRLSQDPLVEARANAKVLAEDEEIKEIANDAQMKRILELSKPLTYWRKKIMKGLCILEWFYMPATPQKAAEIIDGAYGRFYAMTEPDYDWQREPRRFSLTSAKFNYHGMVDMLLYIMEPTYHTIHDIYLRLAADKQGSRIIIALRRYKNQNGFWPVNLNDVKSMAPVEIFVDPINGGDFVYEITEENFRLYSKGRNGIDEDGERDEIAGADDWLIWPPCSEKSEKEQTDEQQD